MKSVALHNLGCKVNAYEIDVMGQMLQEKGYKIVPFDEKADIYIINTCTVTNIADRKSRQMLHRAKKQNPAAVVVAVGCYVQTGKDSIEKDECIDLAVGNNKKKELVPILEEFLAARDSADKTLSDTTVIDINQTKEYEEMTLTHTTEHTRAYIKIQDGCNQFCTYCIIPYARGRVRSRKKEDILTEVQGLSEAGYQEVVLTGIHISSYGMDSGESLLGLIREIHKVKGLKRIRLGSLEPRIITEDFAKELAELPKVCPHFHLSLQSGCDRTLERMNRHYTTSEYYEKVLILRKYFTNPAITTDIITGFPQETEEEFEQTRAFIEKVKFYETHIFKYSKRQGTKAAEMSGQVAETIKADRSHVLLEADKNNAKAYREGLTGTTREVLFEENSCIDGKNYMIGHTAEYVKAAKQTEENLSNQIISGKLTGFLKEDLLLMDGE